jgi:pimeloyl-ACP methyl ester carboxylesterase
MEDFPHSVRMPSKPPRPVAPTASPPTSLAARPLPVALFAVGLVLAACSSDSAVVPGATTSPGATAVPSTTRSPAPSTIPTTPAPAPTTTEAVQAPLRADAATSERMLEHPIVLADEPCPESIGTGSRCGVATVPLDWTRPEGESIAVWYAVQPAKSQPAAGTLIPLEGGPGAAISTTATSFVDLVDAVATHDTLFVDVRGVGRSSQLACPVLNSLTTATPSNAAGQCAQTLGARRDYFNTVSTVLDIEAIRRALDLGPPSLYGVSYGTFVASIYTILFPELVRATVLDGAFPLVTDRWGGDIPIEIATSASSQCERSSDCDPTLMVQQIAEVAAELQRSPRQFEGRAVPFTEGDLINFSQGVLQSGWNEYRLAIDAAADGDFSQIEALDRTSRELQAQQMSSLVADSVMESTSSTALTVAVVCNDYSFPYDVAASPEARQVEFDKQLAALPQDVFGPFSKPGWIQAVWDHPNECLSWPQPATPNALKAPVLGPFPKVPVLVTNGDLDLQTPLPGAVVAQRQWPVSTLIAVRNGTHVVVPQSPCVLSAAATFLTSTALPEPDVCSTDELPLPTFTP